MSKISRESVPVLLAQILEKYIECGVTERGVTGCGALPDVGSEPRSFYDEVRIASFDGSNAQVVRLEVMFPRVWISWQHAGSLCSGDTEFYVNDRFLSIKCTNCSRMVTAVLLRKKIQCPWCAQAQSFSSPKKVIEDLHKAHEIIEQYDPSWSGLEAKGKHEWLDGY